MTWSPITDPLDRTRFPVDPWVLREVSCSQNDLGIGETLFAVGNGYLGMRGNVEEGRNAFEHGTYVNGFHETFRIRHAEDAFGFAKVGQTIVNVPDAKVIRLYVDDEPLLLGVADLERYERALDFKNGLLRRELVWRTSSGKRAHIRSTRLVSFPEKHLAMMTYEVTMDTDAPIMLASQLINRQDGGDEYHLLGADAGQRGFDPRKTSQLSERVLRPELGREEDEGQVVFLGYRAINSGMTVAVGMDHLVETANDYAVANLIEPDIAKTTYTVQARADVPFKLVKLVSYHTSRGVPTPELAERGRVTLRRAREAGEAAIQKDQRIWLDKYWELSDVVVHGQAAVQQAVRWNLYHVAQAAARAEGAGIAAKGVTGSGYSGHYFWDSEIYIMPFLTFTNPGWARNALRFRYTMLEAARRRASEMSEAGALYPWRTINGEEASAYYAAGTAQYHIDADIAYALVQYLQVTGDVDFLEREGIDILVETARMWSGLGFIRRSGPGGRGQFHIHGVTGPDEYTTVVNDNLFTNVMARFNLRAAAQALRSMEGINPVSHQRAVARLGLLPDEPTSWMKAANAMHIPYDDLLGIHPQDDQFLKKELWDLEATPPSQIPLLLNFHPLVIYRFQVLKQADVVLAQFLASKEFTAKQKLADFDYYDPLTAGDSSLSAVAQAIMAAEVGYQELALKYFGKALYVDLGDYHGNAADGVHVASAGGVWSVLVCGFAGLRTDAGQLEFSPRLPELWDGLTFKLRVGDTLIDVDLLQNEMVFTGLSGSGAEVIVCGDRVEVLVGVSVSVPLAGQGPRLLGAPTARDIAGALRADGSIITASVPVSPEDTAEMPLTSLNPRIY
ncbi:MAG: glycoside hydrolase family 65 protein [Micrococcales bacterium]|nr:glycoside hydrolase family 65 protein [Micrococcales bacterium]